MDNRTRIVFLDVATYCGMLAVFLWSGRKLPNVEDRPLDAVSLFAGAVEGFCTLYVTEREPVTSLLDSFAGQLVFAVVSWLWVETFHRFVPVAESATIGALVGGVWYRLVFGVLFDVPDGRRRKASIVDRLW